MTEYLLCMKAQVSLNLRLSMARQSSHPLEVSYAKSALCRSYCVHTELVFHQWGMD